MLTHAELKARALADVQVQAEYQRLNREEFALLDDRLAARPSGQEDLPMTAESAAASARNRG